MKPELLDQLFERAQAEEIGIVITTNNAHGLIPKLHIHRKDLPQFSNLTIALSSEPNVIFITKATLEDLHDIP